MSEDGSNDRIKSVFKMTHALNKVHYIAAKF